MDSLEWAATLGEPGVWVAAGLLISSTVVLQHRSRARRTKRLTLCLSAARIRGRELGGSLALVGGVYQPARRGSKAVIVWQPSGERQDTWFWGWQAKTGVYVVIRGGTGWGPHNRNPAVMYVEHEGVLDVIDPRALRSWTRRNSRLVERARSEMPEVDNS